MKYTITSFFIVFTVVCHAQEVEREVVSSAGDNYSNGTAQLSVTIGEVVTATVSNGTNELTQGFHQTKITVTNIEDYLNSLEMSVFPNPTSETVTIKLKKLEENLSLTLYSVDGKLLLNNNIKSVETKLSLNPFAKGTYFINVVKDGGKVKTYKILKQ